MKTRSAGTFNVEVLTAAGSTQTDATAIPIKSSPALVLAAGNDILGIRLPPATKGKIFYVKNTGTGGFTGKLRVYPSTGDGINLLSANSPLDLPTLTATTFIAKDTVTWYTVPAIPS